MTAKSNVSYNPENVLQKKSVSEMEHAEVKPLPYTADDLLAILLSAPDTYIFIIDRSFKLLLFSDSVKKISKQLFGLDAEKGMDVLLMAQPERKEIVRKIYLSVFEGKSYETETEILTPDGIVYSHNFFRPAKNINGEIIGAIVNAVDVSEKRKAELEILKTKNNLDLLLNNTQEYFILIDQNFRILLMNQALRDGVSENLNNDVYIGESVLDIDPTQTEEINERRKRNIKDAFKGITTTSEFSIQSVKNNQTIYFESNFKPAYDKDGNISAVIITIRDISQIKIAQESVRENEERYRFAMEGSNLGLWDWNIKTGDVYYSESYKKLYGYSDNDLKSLVIEWERNIHPDDKGIVEKNLQQHLNSPDPYLESIYRFKIKGGDYRWILARGMIISRDVDGSPLRMIGTHMDITESKEQDESFRMLFYNHPLPMWMYDVDSYQFIEVNEAAIKHYGYSREEFMKMSIKDIRPKEEIPKLERVLNDLKEDRSHHYSEVWRHKKKNGEIIFVQIKSQRLERQGNKYSFVSINDVTEKIKAENELLLSEKQYRFLFKNHPLPSWIYDTNNWKFLEVNNAAVKFYGYSREEFLNMSLPEIYPPEQRSLFQKRRQEESSKKAITVQQWKHQKKTGEINIVNVRENSIVYNTVDARLMVIEDVTQKAKAEKELKDINERYTLAVKATSDAIYDSDLVKGTIAWGNGLQKRFGYASQEINVQSWDNHIHPSDRERVSKSLSFAINNTNRSYWSESYRFLKKDNTYSYVMDKGYIVRNAEKKAVRIIGAMQDITDIKKKERELEESNERFDTVMSATHDLIWDWNLQTGKFYRDQEGLQKVYGVKNAKTIQNIYHWLQRIHPNDQKHLQNIIDEILHAKGEQTFEVEYRFKRDDGTYSYVYDRGKILCNEEGKPERMIGAAQDITERKKLEQQLLQKELEKQKVISKATIETQEQERGEIGKELHDNVNQVLTTTKLYLELSITNPELKDDLIYKSVKNVMYVIDEIRQLSRSLLNPSIGDLGLIDSIRDLIENINITRKLHIIMDNSVDAEEGLTDNIKLMIFRIIQEALNNSLKHAHASTVLLTLRKKKGHLKLNIIDDGIGFDLESVKKGAGLKNIQNRVYLANGSLSINSAKGQGCKLIIDIPLTEETHK